MCGSAGVERLLRYPDSLEVFQIPVEGDPRVLTCCRQLSRCSQAGQPVGMQTVSRAPNPCLLASGNGWQRRSPGPCKTGPILLLLARKSRCLPCPPFPSPPTRNGIPVGVSKFSGDSSGWHGTSKPVLFLSFAGDLGKGMG